MKSLLHGANTLEVEVANIDAHGFWLFLSGKEYFLPYEDFPWFKEARVSDIINVQLLHGLHLYWPTLDVDLTVESLDNLKHYPLVAE